MDEIVFISRIPHRNPWAPCIPPNLIRGGKPDIDNDTEANGNDMALTGSPNVITNQKFTHRAIGPGGLGEMGFGPGYLSARGLDSRSSSKPAQDAEVKEEETGK